MSLDHAILGFLSYQPMSGYDLKSVFDASVRHFWPADQSQIYRTLSRLAEHGLTRVELIEQDDRPDRKVYHLTDAGRAEMERWLRAPLPDVGRRYAELVQVFFAGQTSDEDALAMVRRMKDRCGAELDKLRAIPDIRETHGREMPRDAFFWALTLEYGIRMTEASLEWLEEVTRRLEAGEHRREPGT